MTQKSPQRLIKITKEEKRKKIMINMKKEENRFAPMMNIKFTILSCFLIFNLMWGEVAYHAMSKYKVS